VVGTIMARFTGSAGDRAAQTATLIEEIVEQAAQKHPGNGVDLVVVPEYALQVGLPGDARTNALDLKHHAIETVADKAREHRTWVVLPMFLRDPDGLVSNAAVLLNREGAVAGIYRKVHPVADPRGVLEGGVTPGNDFLTFNCDFGRLGILICYDMSYDQAWSAMGRQRAEIVALPSASPQTIRPSAEAQRHRFYVVTATPRDNASVFDPIGMTIAQTVEQRVLVHEIDLAYAVLHWTASLENGRAFSRRFGERVGYTYSSREDTGVFWSNDPAMSIGDMAKQLGLREMSAAVEYSRQLQDQARRPAGIKPEAGKR
jgi:predicted amidohydrolase